MEKKEKNSSFDYNNMYCPKRFSAAVIHCTIAIYLWQALDHQGSVSVNTFNAWQGYIQSRKTAGCATNSYLGAAISTRTLRLSYLTFFA
jgi:hypothetical protein